ncbi:MAG: hypothetical protein JWN44_5067 [Myxococcales bacterium]|nr:hypothetical protein [Myxococcales bacterium]
MRGAWIGLALVAMLSGSAVAAPLKIRNGSTVRVALQGKRETGVGLRNARGGWRLELVAATTDVADVVDVTDGANSARWTVDVADGALFLDEERFIAGHAYRVSLRHGTELLGSTLVYLYAPSVSARHKVTFEENDGAAGGGDIAILKKPTL